MKKRYAKKIYSFDLGYKIDRTTQKHLLGKYDVDFRKKNAPNPEARLWTYGGSRKTYATALKDTIRIRGKTGAETRIVDAETGEILTDK